MFEAERDARTVSREDMAPDDVDAPAFGAFM